MKVYPFWMSKVNISFKKKINLIMLSFDFADLIQIENTVQINYLTFIQNIKLKQDWIDYS